MANRFEFKLPHEFIVIDCNCGQKYVLFTVYSDDELEERRNSRYCPYCGVKNQEVFDEEEQHARKLRALNFARGGTELPGKDYGIGELEERPDRLFDHEPLPPLTNRHAANKDLSDELQQLGKLLAEPILSDDYLSPQGKAARAMIKKVETPSPDWPNITTTPHEIKQLLWLLEQPVFVAALGGFDRKNIVSSLQDFHKLLSYANRWRTEGKVGC